MPNINSDSELMIANVDKIPTFFIHHKNGQPSFKEVLDYIICSPKTYSKIEEIDIIDNLILGSDHSPILDTINQKKNSNKLCKREVLVYEKANWYKFRDYLNQNSELNNELQNIDEMTKLIESKINQAIKISIPTIKVFLKE